MWFGLRSLGQEGHYCPYICLFFLKCLFPLALFDIFYCWFRAVFYIVSWHYFTCYIYIAWASLSFSDIEWSSHQIWKKKCWSLFLQIANLFFQLLFQLRKYSILSHRKLAVFFQGFYLFVSSLFCILDSLLLWLYVH